MTSTSKIQLRNAAIGLIINTFPVASAALKYREYFQLIKKFYILAWDEQRLPLLLLLLKIHKGSL